MIPYRRGEELRMELGEELVLCRPEAGRVRSGLEAGRGLSLTEGDHP